MDELNFQKYGEYQPTSFDSSENYIGEKKGDLKDWLVCNIGKNRDSGLLDQSNFDSFLKELSVEPEGKNWKVLRFGHWACGWYEIVLVKPNTKSFELADNLLEQIKDYPVLNEEHHSSLESEALEDFINNEIQACRNLFLDDVALKDIIEDLPELEIINAMYSIDPEYENDWPYIDIKENKELIKEHLLNSEDVEIDELSSRSAHGSNMVLSFIAEHEANIIGPEKSLMDKILSRLDLFTNSEAFLDQDIKLLMNDKVWTVFCDSFGIKAVSIC